MFSDHARPFYNSALPMPLSKPPVEDSREFVRSHFADAGVHAGDEEVEAILRISDNIPYYLQAVSSFVFETVTLSNRETVAAEDVEKAADELVALNASYYSTLIRGLSDSQKALVLALAREPTREFDEGYRLRHDLPASSTIHSALKELIKDAVVEGEGDGPYRIGDPMLSRYVQTPPGKVMA